MRYPITLIPGLPVTPDVGIGITMTPVQPTAPATSIGAGGGNGGTDGPSVVWAMYPRTTDDDTLGLERGFGLGAPATSDPPNACVNRWGFTYAPGVAGCASAVVKDVPDGGVVTWEIGDITLDFGDTMSTDDLADGVDVLIDDVVHFSIRYADNLLWCSYTADANLPWNAWALDPITLIASIDGEPLRTLTLNVSALANFGG